MNNTLAKLVATGEVVGAPKFHVDDCVILTRDFMSRHDKTEDRYVLVPAGVKAIITEVEADHVRFRHKDKRGEWYGIGFVVENHELDILQRFEPDDFDRAWLTMDYEEARRLFDAR